MRVFQPIVLQFLALEAQNIIHQHQYPDQQQQDQQQQLDNDQPDDQQQQHNDQQFDDQQQDEEVFNGLTTDVYCDDGFLFSNEALCDQPLPTTFCNVDCIDIPLDEDLESCKWDVDNYFSDDASWKQ